MVTRHFRTYSEPQYQVNKPVLKTWVSQSKTIQPVSWCIWEISSWSEFSVSELENWVLCLGIDEEGLCVLYLKVGDCRINYLCQGVNISPHRVRRLSGFLAVWPVCYLNKIRFSKARLAGKVTSIPYFLNTLGQKSHISFFSI